MMNAIMHDRGRRWSGNLRAALLAGTLMGVVVAVASCDFDVTNPGPIHDENLDDPAAHASVVTGAMRNVLQGLSNFGHYGGAVSRDFHAGAHTFSHGIPFQIELSLLSDEWTAGSGWSNTHEGRWIGEHMAARIEETMGAEAGSHPPLAGFYLWAGLANRILGEHVCTAVFDGGPTEPYVNHFTRAVDHFTRAAEVAAATGDETTRLAALGARAAAHVWLGSWTEAAEDAAQVPFDFVFEAEYTNETRYIIAPAMGWTFRSITLWDTFAEDYFLDSGDPRVAWGHDPDVPADVARPTWGRIIPMYYPLKFYAPRHADEHTRYDPDLNLQVEIPVNLVSGREMVLIRAEALLEQGNWQGAMDLINQVRTTAADPGTGEVGSYFTGEPLEPVTASSLEDAWAALKFERLVEMNMEGRHFGDRKRWAENDTPGELHSKLLMPDHHVEAHGAPKVPNVCFPIPLSEKERNENIAEDFVDQLISG